MNNIQKKTGSRGKAPSTSFSMSSSSIFRNEKLTLLDDQFDRIMEEYSDGEIGELDPNDEEVQGRYDPLTNMSAEGEDMERLNEMFDQFLSSTELNSSETRLQEKEIPSDNLTYLRNELKDCAKSVVGTYGYVTDFIEGPIKRPEAKKERWDCETILTGMTNIYNRPSLIKEINTKGPMIKIGKRGVPKIIQDPIPEKDEESIDQNNEEESKNETITRQKSETKEEKKLRKLLVKETKRVSRQIKKETKIMFKNEIGIQKGMVLNNSMQKKVKQVQ